MLKSTLKPIMLVIFAFFLSNCDTQSGSSVGKEIVFASLPYADHSQVIIGKELGLFEAEGIKVELRHENASTVVSKLSNGTYDVASVAPPLVYQESEITSDVVMFVFHAIFKGFAVLGPKDSMAFPEYLEQGLEPLEAAKRTLKQIENGKLIVPEEGGPSGFIDALINIGELNHDLVETGTEAQNLAKIRSAPTLYFHVGGAPYRVKLDREGFKTLLTTEDLINLGQNLDTGSVFPEAWAIKRTVLEEDPDLVCRLARVSFAISRFILDEPLKAATIHAPYLSKIAGEVYEPEDLLLIYQSYDPFFSSAEQKGWFTNPQSEYFIKPLLEASANSVGKDPSIAMNFVTNDGSLGCVTRSD